jgi:hypothetical protein
MMDGFKLGSRLGWPDQETNDVMQYWEAEHLIEFVAVLSASLVEHQ